jgi:hypothetical protein
MNPAAQRVQEVLAAMGIAPDELLKVTGGTVADLREEPV